MALGGMDMTENTRLEAVPRENEQTLRRDQIWLTAQGNAFRAAMNGAPLETSLGLLMQTVVEQADGEPRCAFYISDGCGGLRHVVGMSDAYAAQVRDLEISAESLAVAKGEPVITPDVLEEPRWRPWLWLAQEHGYRASWSFPVETASGKLVGSCAMYYREPRKPSAQDLDLTSGLTQTAAFLISWHQESDERARAEAAMRESEARQVFLLKFSDALRPVADAVEAQRVAMRLLGELLRAEQTFYYRTERTDDDWVHVVDEDYYRTPSMPARVGRRAQSDFGPALFAPLARGDAVTVDDVDALDGLSERQRDNFRSANIRSFVGRPVIKNGRYVAGVSALTPTPRTWAAHEIVLIQDVAERTWAAAERARAEAALHEREATLRLLLTELQHRVRNMLATVRAIASRTSRTYKLLDDFQAHFDGRLSALGRTQNVLTRTPGVGVDLENLIRDELLAQAAPNQCFSLGGPDTRLSPKAAEVVTLAIHELATNSTKYGALAHRGGRIDIQWSKTERGNESWLALGWTESGLRLPKTTPVREGFGTELITRRVPHELHGEGSIGFEQSGVRVLISFPLRDATSTLEMRFR
jgi:two-component sensor histidine kinase